MWHLRVRVCHDIINLQYLQRVRMFLIDAPRQTSAIPPFVVLPRENGSFELYKAAEARQEAVHTTLNSGLTRKVLIDEGLEMYWFDG